MILAGALCAALIGGETAGVLAIVLIGSGFVGLVGMAFLEVGLSEDRERARTLESERRAREREQRWTNADQPRLRRRPLGRMRGRRRRLG